MIKRRWECQLLFFLREVGKEKKKKKKAVQEDRIVRAVVMLHWIPTADKPFEGGRGRRGKSPPKRKDWEGRRRREIFMRCGSDFVPPAFEARFFVFPHRCNFWSKYFWQRKCRNPQSRPQISLCKSVKEIIHLLDARPDDNQYKCTKKTTYQSRTGNSSKPMR